jgi:hypothetical protein
LSATHSSLDTCPHYHAMVDLSKRWKKLKLTTMAESLPRNQVPSKGIGLITCLTARNIFRVKMFTFSCSVNSFKWKISYLIKLQFLKTLKILNTPY